MKDKINIINNYRSLPIGKYLDILAISKNNELEDVDKQVQIISILTGLTEDTILDLQLPEFSRLCEESRFLETPSDDIHMRVAKSYKCGGFDLVPTTDLRRITTAQYIDFQTFVSNSEDNIIHILSCFLVPQGMVYGHGYDILDVKDAISRDMSVAEAVSLYAFFFISFKNLIRDSLTYSMQEAKRIKDKTKREKMTSRIREQMEILSIVNGDGSQM